LKDVIGVLTYSPCYTLFVGNRVVDCGVYTGGDGFYILGDCDVINNEFSITADPANSNATFWFEDNIGTGPGVALYGGTVNIIGNTFRTYTVPLISDGFSGATPLSVKLNIINNIFDSAGGVSFISLTSNTAIAFTSLVIKGNKISGRIYLTSFPSVIISGNDINATGNALTITNAAGLHIINNNQITAASTGIVLTAPSSNSSVIKIRRNYIAAPTGVTNTSSYYTALDDDNVRI
jgi:hypothetical protein